MNEPTLQRLLDPRSVTYLVASGEGQALAMISQAHAEGLACPLYTSEAAAGDSVERHAPLPLQRLPAPPLWPLSQLLAEQGFAGILVDEEVPLYFVTTEAGSTLPTHVALPDGETLIYLGPAGVEDLDPLSTVLWSRPEAFDRLSIRWLLGAARPFGGYEAGMALFEYAPNGVARTIPERGMLLPADEQGVGSVALFSTAFAAEWYWEHVVEAPLTGAGPHARELQQHLDTVARLEAIAATAPEAAIILNPGRHRFYQGFFRRVEGIWLLITISGVWRLAPPFDAHLLARRTV